MISDTIKEIRKKYYLNQTAFANRIGVTQGSVSQWENGLTKPSFEQMKSISNAFGISIDELLNEEKVQDKEATPRTQEAKIVSIGMDKLPKQDREKILAVIRAMYDDKTGLFSDDEDDLPLMG